MSTPHVRREADTLCFRGDLVVESIPAVWAQASAVTAGTTRFDLTAVGRVDSAGVAMLAELAQRGGVTTIDGDPTGLSSLRAAYRLDAMLGYAG